MHACPNYYSGPGQVCQPDRSLALSITEETEVGEGSDIDDGARRRQTRIPNLDVPHRRCKEQGVNVLCISLVRVSKRLHAQISYRTDIVRSTTSLRAL
jgi:hypothetical protein